MKTKILAGLLLAGSTMFAAPRIGFSVGFEAPAPVVAVAPPCPGPGYVFVDGYWRFNGAGPYWGGYRGRFDGGHFDRGRFDRDGGHFRR